MRSVQTVHVPVCLQAAYLPRVCSTILSLPDPACMSLNSTLSLTSEPAQEKRENREAGRCTTRREDRILVKSYERMHRIITRLDGRTCVCG